MNHVGYPSNWFVKTVAIPAESHEYLMDSMSVGECEDETIGISYEWAFRKGVLRMFIIIDDRSVVRGLNNGQDG